MVEIVVYAKDENCVFLEPQATWPVARVLRTSWFVFLWIFDVAFGSTDSRVRMQPSQNSEEHECFLMERPYALWLEFRAHREFRAHLAGNDRGRARERAAFARRNYVGFWSLYTLVVLSALAFIVL